MQKSSLYITIGLLVTLVIAIYSCKKVNGINNDQVVETPFSLFFADSAGVVYNSTDGKSANVIFPSDGYPVRAICVANNNILVVKQNLYISTNNGKNFNPTYDTVTSYPGHACNGFPFDLNQSMIINIPSWPPNITYCVSNSSLYNNFAGLVYNYVSATPGNWNFERTDTTGNVGNLSVPAPIRITSLTLLTDGVLAGYDAMHNRNFYRTQGSYWNECTANPDTSIGFYNYGSPISFSGSHLPYNDLNGTTVDTSARYSYGHYNKQLIAIDQKNCHQYGAYFSNDTGRNWAPMNGLPSTPLLCIESPFESVCLIGTAGSGLYILNTNTNVWQANNQGLAQNLTVHSIAAKQMFYKGGKITNFIFLATNAGIYQSTDGGNNWTLNIPGNFTAIY